MKFKFFKSSHKAFDSTTDQMSHQHLASPNIQNVPDGVLLLAANSWPLEKRYNFAWLEALISLANGSWQKIVAESNNWLTFVKQGLWIPIDVRWISSKTAENWTLTVKRHHCFKDNWSGNDKQLPVSTETEDGSRCKPFSAN